MSILFPSSHLNDAIGPPPVTIWSGAPLHSASTASSTLIYEVIDFLLLIVIIVPTPILLIECAVW